MKTKSKKILCIIKNFLIFYTFLHSSMTYAYFELIPLGVYGGTDTSNLTSFLLKSSKHNKYICLDAGTVATGIDKALKQGSINLGERKNRTGFVFRNLIDSYWISHGHLDHIAGLVALSPEDTNKNIYGINSTITSLRDYYFNWVSWPNMTNEGLHPLDKYNLISVDILSKFNIGETGLKGVAYPLDHGVNPVTGIAYPSSALKISEGDNEFVFFGDTGPDAEQKSKKLNDIWVSLADDVKQKKLKAIAIEVSYNNGRQAKNLMGHLNPKALYFELSKLEKYSGGKGSLRGLKVFIIHVKPINDLTGLEASNKIMKELMSYNDLGVVFIRPKQGKLYKI
ncbi:3',5'-cyclic-nucleotide phosphodiesterase [Salmonella enterica]|nr:3',5'-cyclic-nucleotide phosphodiesterase [Salmonella enterica]ECF8134856.1 3',5'-cyclic-nucleotide phosphodiesterase [Salmonella enterica]EGI1955485.1 3',5'-cyclic-nucleotide phosphodiesterase [Salmonella enterica]EMA3598509.1 3',5'-cyclic-nucleotide phosphodiesterase [Salmonella enterica]